MTFLEQLAGRIRAAWRVLTRSRRLEHDMADEMRFHVEMEADRLARERGLRPDEATRQAHVRFGGVESYKEAGRDARGRRWLDALIVDAKLSVRMLFKHKGLTFVGGFAMAVAIGLGATAFEVLGEVLATSLPFDQGDRVVALRLEGTGNPNLVRDLFAAKDRLTSIHELSAFRSVDHNLAAPPAQPGLIHIAEMTASGFAIARTHAELGRHLLPSDEDPAATPALVIGHRAWQTQFAADPNIVGRVVTLSGVAHTIVGVMPEGFGFPIDFQYWTPLRAHLGTDRRASRSTIYLFARLADGLSDEQAEAELTPLARRDVPTDGVEQQPHVAVLPYTREHADLSDPDFVNLFILIRTLTGTLAFVVAINLAILFYARTVTRYAELAVRTALGASRLRLLSQLFVEALALSVVGAAAGLLCSSMVLRYAQSFVRSVGRVPYWIQFELSPATIVDAFALAVLTALIVGVLPGVKATGKRINLTLNGLSGRTAPRLGPIWTTLVGAQVAAAVAVLPAACFVTWQTLQMEFTGPGFDAHKFIVSLVSLPDHDGPVDARRVAEVQRDMMTRLQMEPGAGAVTFTSSIPGFARGGVLEFAPRTPLAVPGPWTVSQMYVASDMLDVFGAEVLAGRRFTAADIGAAHTVVVNETFTRWLPAGASALGTKFRYVSDAGTPITNGPLYEIVGVVRDLPRTPEALNLDTPAVVFHAAALGTVNPVFLAVRFDRELPADSEPRLRQLAMAVDPALQIRSAGPLTTYYTQLRMVWRIVSWSAALATLSGLLLSAAGMYALMSFTVAQRTREIGIRVALGARPRRLFLAIFSRALRQLVIGIVAGSLLSSLVIAAVGLEMASAVGLLATVAAIMTIVGLLAAIGPARRSLRIAASEALRAEN